jgi:hypothetical protein
MIGYAGMMGTYGKTRTLSENYAHCKAARAAKAQGKRQYKYANVKNQIAKFCSLEQDYLDERESRQQEADLANELLSEDYDLDIPPVVTDEGGGMSALLPVVIGVAMLGAGAFILLKK